MPGVILDFVWRNPYLFSNVPGLAIVIFLARRTRYRDYARAAIFSGLACIPCSLAEPLSGAYWRPKLLGGMTWGVESALFTFVSGATVWMIATAAIRKDCSIKARSFAEIFRRMTPGALAVTALFLVLLRLGVNCVTAAVVSPVPLLIFLLFRRSSLWRLSVAGLVGFTPFYALVVKLQFAVWPNYLSYWNPGGTWGTLVFGVPRGEVAWAAIMGATWPVAIASALNVRFAARAAQADFALHEHAQPETVGRVCPVPANAAAANDAGAWHSTAMAAASTLDSDRTCKTYAMISGQTVP
jgi:hypothetical protein